MKVLVAEDNKVDSKIIETYLKNMDYEVSLANDGNTALEIYEEGNFQLVLLDWMMPGIEGTEICKRIREINHRRDTYCYIIMVTAKDTIEDFEGAFSAGVDEFIPKPVDPRILSVRMRAGERMVKAYHSLADKNRSLEVFQSQLTNYNQELEKEEFD